MAFTASSIVKTVFGDMRVHVVRYTADAATQAIDSGLDFAETFNTSILLPPL